MLALTVLLLWLLAAAGVALPRRRAEQDRACERGGPRDGGGRAPRVCAVVPYVDSPATVALAARLVDYVEHVTIVGPDGTGDHLRLSELLSDRSIHVLPTGPTTRAKGALAHAGVDHVLREHAPDAVLIADPDSAPSADVVWRFIAGVHAHDAVVGDRTVDDRPVVWRRLRAAARAGVARMLRRPVVPDGECAVRIISARALRAVPVPRDGRRVHARHVRAMLAHGLDVAWVPVPRRTRRGAHRPTCRRAATGAVVALAACGTVAAPIYALIAAL